MKFEHSITISSEPEKIYSVFKQVSQWPLWDVETESASIEGDFVVGANGKIKPKGAPESKIILTEITPNQSFTVECGLPLCKMHFVHTLHKVEQGTEVINRVLFTGLLGPLFARFIGNGINKTIPGSLQGLKDFVEKPSQ